MTTIQIARRQTTNSTSVKGHFARFRMLIATNCCAVLRGDGNAEALLDQRRVAALAGRAHAGAYANRDEAALKLAA